MRSKVIAGLGTGAPRTGCALVVHVPVADDMRLLLQERRVVARLAVLGMPLGPPGMEGLRAIATK